MAGQRGKSHGSRSLSVILLPTYISEFDRANALRNETERQACPDSPKLFMISKENELSSSLFGICTEARQLTAFYHASLMDDENVVAAKLVSATSPAILQ